MLEKLRADLLFLLYDHPECDHLALLQALVAYAMPDTPDDEFYFSIDTLNQITNQTWALEVA